MLVSSYNPASETTCPHCQGVVKCLNIGGITWGFDPYLDFFHEACGTSWRYHIRTGETECPIPKPMGMREAMGEKNYNEMIYKQQLMSFAIEMFEALEQIVDSGGNSAEGLEKATEVVAEVRKKYGTGVQQP